MDRAQNCTRHGAHNKQCGEKGVSGDCCAPDRRWRQLFEVRYDSSSLSLPGDWFGNRLFRGDRHVFALAPDERSTPEVDTSSNFCSMKVDPVTTAAWVEDCGGHLFGEHCYCMYAYYHPACAKIMQLHKGAVYSDWNLFGVK